MNRSEHSDASASLMTPSIAAVLNRVQGGAQHEAQLQRASGYCSELIEVELPGGDALMLKRAHFDWVGARLRASRAAANLLRRRTGVLVPRHLDLERDARGRAIEAYWRIPLPTLQEVWAALPEKQQPQALRSWGALLRRVHKATPGGYGRLLDAGQKHQLDDFLHTDLRDRLRPALKSVWPFALASVDALLRGLDGIGELLAGRPAVLVHNDFHMGNVLCERRPRSIRCVGVIDLESAWSGPAESDVAQLQVLHGPAFGYPLAPDWTVHFARGYGASLDRELLRFFRMFHLLNLGYFAAEAGWARHVDDLARELTSEMNGCSIYDDGAFSPGSTE